ncbi:hypothetical protein PTI98_008430 [Pleurotus ostreatus]|nr:hypothetical protein PTI98_008430 [Pleurotus ostreatus]
MSPSLVPAAVDLTPRVESNSPIPVPGAAILAFDNTLGALFIGSSLATILYGILCLQIFIYITSYRTRQDSQWTRLSISFILCAESNSYSSAHIHHRNFLVAAGHDDSNDVQVLGVGLYESVCSGFRRRRQRFTFAQLIAGSCGILLTQLFFSWRVWMISRRSFRVPLRVIISTLTVILALFSFGYYIDLAVKGFNRVNTPDFTVHILPASTPGFNYLSSTIARVYARCFKSSTIRHSHHVCHDHHPLSFKIRSQANGPRYYSRYHIHSQHKSTHHAALDFRACHFLRFPGIHYIRRTWVSNPKIIL